MHPPDERRLPTGRARRSRRRNAFLAAIAGAAIAILGPAPARAQGKLEARYTATLSGIPVGKGGWTVEIRDRRYSAVAEGRVIGIMRALTRGDGTASAEGAMAGGGLVPTAYTVHTGYDHRRSDVRMTLNSGTVTDLLTEPAPATGLDRVPLTEAHRRGVVDPMTAALIGIPGHGEMVSAEACARTLPIFDGYYRFDLALSFRRIETVKAEHGYEGPVVVCGVTYRPVAGHKPSRFEIRYMTAQRDMEIWFAPIAGTRVLAPFRFYVPTLLGPAVLQATEFRTGSASRANAEPADAKTQ